MFYFRTQGFNTFFHFCFPKYNGLYVFLDFSEQFLLWPLGTPSCCVCSTVEPVLWLDLLFSPYLDSWQRDKVFLLTWWLTQVAHFILHDFNLNSELCTIMLSSIIFRIYFVHFLFVNNISVTKNKLNKVYLITKILWLTQTVLSRTFKFCQNSILDHR